MICLTLIFAHNRVSKEYCGSKSSNSDINSRYYHGPSVNKLSNDFSIECNFWISLREAELQLSTSFDHFIMNIILFLFISIYSYRILDIVLLHVSDIICIIVSLFCLSRVPLSLKSEYIHHSYQIAFDLILTVYLFWYICRLFVSWHCMSFWIFARQIKRLIHSSRFIFR
jgi:hypothetical protein